MKNDITEQLVHKTSNLLAAIYTFCEPALESGEGMREALEEILKIGVEVEITSSLLVKCFVLRSCHGRQN